VDVAKVHRHSDAIDVLERHRVGVEAGRLETRERVERIDGARGLAIVFRLDVEAISDTPLSRATARLTTAGVVSIGLRSRDSLTGRSTFFSL